MDAVQEKWPQLRSYATWTLLQLRARAADRMYNGCEIERVVGSAQIGLIEAVLVERGAV